MASASDPRDRITGQIQLLVDAALNDPTVRESLDRAWFSDDAGTAVPGGWPSPNARNRRHALQCVRAAAPDAITGMRQLGAHHPELLIASLRRVQRRGKPAPIPAGFCPTPLVATVVEPAAFRHLMTVAGYLYADLKLPATNEPLFAEDIRVHLVRRLNAFALLESQLWWYASLAGYPDPPPYSVRYDIARWLWSPEIAGTIICLRCGVTHINARRGRSDTQRSPRCRACARGTTVDWPHHAVEPHTRGTWLLQCATPGCTALFAGRRHARHCARHRLNRLTARQRPRGGS